MVKSYNDKLHEVCGSVWLENKLHEVCGSVWLENKLHEVCGSVYLHTLSNINIFYIIS